MTTLTREQWKAIKRPGKKLVNLLATLSYSEDQVQIAVDTVYSQDTCSFYNYWETRYQIVSDNLPMPWTMIHKLCDYLRDTYVGLNADTMWEPCSKKLPDEWISRFQYDCLLNGYCKVNGKHIPKEVVILCHKYCHCNYSQIPFFDKVKKYVCHFIAEKWYDPIVPYSDNWKEEWRSMPPSNTQLAKERNRVRKQLAEERKKIIFYERHCRNCDGTLEYRWCTGCTPLSTHKCTVCGYWTSRDWTA